MRAVLDTNVVVSAALTPGGKCSDIIQLWDDGLFAALVTGQVVAEYERVLHRSRLNISRERADLLLAKIGEFAVSVQPGSLEADLPDPGDEIFLQCALGGAANCIVTGNKKHFPAEACRGMPVLSPAEFLLRLPRE